MYKDFAKRGDAFKLAIQETSGIEFHKKMVSYLQKALKTEKVCCVDDKYIVDDTIYFEKETVPFLPDNLIIKGYVYFQFVDFENELPENLIIGQSLWLESSTLKGKPITRLPKGLTVKGCLTLEDVGIDSLPDDIIVYDPIASSNELKIPTMKILDSDMSEREEPLYVGDGFECRMHINHPAYWTPPQALMDHCITSDYDECRFIMDKPPSLSL